MQFIYRHNAHTQVNDNNLDIKFIKQITSHSKRKELNKQIRIAVFFYYVHYRMSVVCACEVRHVLWMAIASKFFILLNNLLNKIINLIDNRRRRSEYSPKLNPFHFHFVDTDRFRSTHYLSDRRLDKSHSQCHKSHYSRDSWFIQFDCKV